MYFFILLLSILGLKLQINKIEDVENFLSNLAHDRSFLTDRVNTA